MSADTSHKNGLLVAEFRSGNQKAFQKLFDLYWEPMYIKAKAILSNRDAAKDVVQDIWVNLWENRKNRDVLNFEAYVYRAVDYGCFKYLRDAKFTASQLQAIEELPLCSPSEAENRHDLEEVRTLIDTSMKALPPRCRQIFRLSRFKENSNEEIAEQLGISKRSVENQVSLALKLIRRNLTTLQSILLILSHLISN